jgi:hypothetical protein
MFKVFVHQRQEGNLKHHFLCINAQPNSLLPARVLNVVANCHVVAT